MSVPSLMFFIVWVAGMSAQAAETGEVTIEEFLQKLSSVPEVVSRKDPFVMATPPFEVIDKANEEEILASAPVLERFPITQYVVVATLLGDQYPRALVRPPDSSKVLIVKQRDKLGNRGGLISKILKDGVVVVQNHKSPLGFVDKAEIVLSVGGEGREKEKKTVN